MNGEKRRVLFICTGNAARSQMAEAIVNHNRRDDWVAFSAGTRPKSEVHPNAIRVLKEIGIDISGARTKSADEFRQATLDLVVTVCDAAAEECPVWLGAGKRVHVGFVDPAKATGSDEQVVAKFRKVRNDMQREILKLLDAFERENVKREG